MSKNDLSLLSFIHQLIYIYLYIYLLIYRFTTHTNKRLIFRYYKSILIKFLHTIQIFPNFQPRLSISNTIPSIQPRLHKYHTLNPAKIALILAIAQSLKTHGFTTPTQCKQWKISFVTWALLCMHRGASVTQERIRNRRKRRKNHVIYCIKCPCWFYSWRW